MAVEPTVEWPDRSFPFEAVFNFRDLGGYAAAGGRIVRWRTLFRADGLNRLTEAEADRLRELGIVTVIDLRTPEELARGRAPEGISDAFHHLPMFDVVPDWSADPDVASPTFLADRYLEMVESGRAAVARALEVLAEPPSLPAVFHCAAGKDRTGIVAAILLELLGVDRSTVVADYALSHDAMIKMEAWISQVHPEWSGKRPAVVIEARPETMETFLVSIDERFGSVEGLVADLGVGRATIEALRRHLLTDG